MKTERKTQVFYSYLDPATGETLQSAVGVTVYGVVTPQKVEAIVLNNWKKIGYNADAGFIRIVHQEPVF